MNCKLSDEYMMKYFDGELNDIENAQLRQHMKTCKRCSQEFGGLDEIVKMLETDSLIEPPEDFEMKVMEKISTLEVSRSKATSRGLVLLYNFTTLVSVVLLLVFVAGLKEINLFGAFSSFSDFTAGIYAFATDAFNMVWGIVKAFIQVAVILVKTYYYVFITLLALLLAVQKTFFILVKQDGGDRK